MTNAQSQWNPWNWFKNEHEPENNRMHGKRGAARGNLPSTMSGTMMGSPASYFGPLSRFYEDMDRMFDNAFRSFGLPGFPAVGMGAGLLEGQGLFLPTVDIAANNNEYKIEVEVPGVEENDVRLELAPDGTLIISGEKKLESEDRDRDFHRIERSFGAFRRVLALPEDVEQEQVEASFKNGVLTITLPRKESSRQQNRQISIHGERESGRRTKPHTAQAHAAGEHSKESEENRQQAHSAASNVNRPGSKKVA